MESTKDPSYSLALDREEQNFVKLAKIILDITPKHLRIFFVKKWNKKFPEQWSSNKISGVIIESKIPSQKKKGCRYYFRIKNKILEGNEQEWDITILTFLLLFSGLNLIEECRKRDERNDPLRESEEIDKIREIRNSYFAHAESMRCSTTEFTQMVAGIKTVADKLFGQHAKAEIRGIENSIIRDKLTGHLKEQLKEQKEYNAMFEEMLHSVEGLIGDVREMKNNVRDLVDSTRDNLKGKKRKPNANAVRKRYNDLCARHEIQCVEKSKIKTKMANLIDFAVRLKMVIGVKQGNDEDLEESPQLEITMDSLVDGKERVTFVSGVAGIGKSVLAKQIVYHWANHDLCKQFDLCLYIQCRRLNDAYQEHHGKSGKSEILDKFVQKALDCDMLDKGVELLIVIDGVDELFDIDEEDSIIFQFLDKHNELYRESSIIMTGRPHIQSVIETSNRDIGEYKVVEIKGLSDKDKQEYIGKFSRYNGLSSEAVIGKVIGTSGDDSEMLCMPQFLNSVCCVFVLNGEQKLESATELCTWILYLLLKQHICERDPISHKYFIPNVFNSCKEIILLLSKISFHLYEKNEIVFERSEFESVFKKIDEKATKTQKSFVNGLFEEVSDNFGEKLQYKHLTLMEFMAAVHIFSESNSIQLIRRILNRKSCDIVHYACGVSGGLLADKIIIKKMVECVMGNAKLDGAKSFLLDVMNSICNCHETDEHKRMSKLVDLVRYLPQNLKDKPFLKDLFGKLNCKSFSPKQEQQRSMVKIYNFLTNCQCDHKEINDVFKDVRIKLLNVKRTEILELIKFFKCVEWLSVRDIFLKKKDIKSIRNNLACCIRADVVQCRYEDPEEGMRLCDDIKKRDFTEQLLEVG